jgi:hypothetical protein
MRSVFTSRSMSCSTVKTASSSFSTGSERSAMQPDSRCRDLSSNCWPLTVNVWCAPKQVWMHQQAGGMNVRKMSAWALVLLSVVAVVAACIAAVWLTNDLRAIGLGIIPVGVISAGLVAYFEWRIKLRRRMLAEAENQRRAA